METTNFPGLALGGGAKGEGCVWGQEWKWAKAAMVGPCFGMTSMRMKTTGMNLTGLLGITVGNARSFFEDLSPAEATYFLEWWDDYGSLSSLEENWPEDEDEQGETELDVQAGFWYAKAKYHCEKGQSRLAAEDALEAIKLSNILSKDFYSTGEVYEILVDSLRDEGEWSLSYHYWEKMIDEAADAHQFEYAKEELDALRKTVQEHAEQWEPDELTEYLDDLGKKAEVIAELEADFAEIDEDI